MNLAHSLRPRLSLWLAAAAIVTAWFVAAVVTDAVPAWRGPAPYPPEWQWMYLPLGGERPARILLPVAILALYLAAVAVGMKRRLPSKAVVGLAVAFLFVWQLVPAWTREASLPHALIERVYAPALNGYFIAPAQADSVPDTLHHYLEVMPTFFADRPKTHPPGLFIFYAVANDLAARAPSLATRFAAIARRGAVAGSDWPLLTDNLILSAFVTAWVQILLTCLAPLALYAMRRQMSPDGGDGEQAAVWSALALPLIAPLTHFLLQWDAVYPALGFTAWAFALRGQNRRRWRDWLWAGLLLSLLTWLSFGMLAFVALVGLHLLWRAIACWRAGEPLRWAGFVVMGAGIALPWLLAYAVWGMNPLALYRAAMGYHYTAVTTLRNAALWRWMNLADFVFWLGPGIVLLGIVGSVWLWRRRTLGDMGALAAIFWLLLLVIDLSGATRGEVGRIWLFLMPFPLLFGMTLPWRTDQRFAVLLLMALTNLTLAYAIAPLSCC